MSFKLKTILLLISLSLTPYVITMTILGNAYRSDYEQRLRNNMEYELGVTIDRLDQNLQALEKDLQFFASLDIMNDILSDDLDRRISNLLSSKKKDLQLIGYFDVVNTESMTIASSDMNRVGLPSAGEGFIEIPVFSTFDQNKTGKLILRYDLSNLARFFANEEHLRYSLIVDGEQGIVKPTFKATLEVRRALGTRPEIEVLLEQDRTFAFSILDNFERSFYIALAIGMFVIAMIALLAGNYIVRPILLLSSTAKSVTKTQDYSQRVNMERSDEIGQLSSSFDLMVNGMQEMIAKLKEESENKLKLMQEKNRAEMLQDLSNKLSKYLSPQIYESIFSGEKDVKLSSVRKKLTILFSDIVGFTATADQIASEDLTQLLNHYLNEMTNIALRHGATLDKYIGDGIMIFFGDPHTLGIEEDARKCLEMAIEMQMRVKELQSEWRSAGYTRPFTLRIGIHTGYCTVGNFGSDNRMDYTIIGSAVNLASRIEASAEPGTIFISEEAYLLVRDKFDCIPASTVTLKGLNQPVQLYKVETSNNQGEMVAIDNEGFQLKYQPNQLTDADRTHLKKVLKDIANKL